MTETIQLNNFLCGKESGNFNNSGNGFSNQCYRASAYQMACSDRSIRKMLAEILFRVEKLAISKDTKDTIDNLLKEPEKLKNRIIEYFKSDKYIERQVTKYININIKDENYEERKKFLGEYEDTYDALTKAKDRKKAVLIKEAAAKLIPQIYAILGALGKDYKEEIDVRVESGEPSTEKFTLKGIDPKDIKDDIKLSIGGEWTGTKTTSEFGSTKETFDQLYEDIRGHCYRRPVITYRRSGCENNHESYWAASDDNLFLFRHGEEIASLSHSIVSSTNSLCGVLDNNGNKCNKDNKEEIDLFILSDAETCQVDLNGNKISSKNIANFKNFVPKKIDYGDYFAHLNNKSLDRNTVLSKAKDSNPYEIDSFAIHSGLHITTYIRVAEKTWVHYDSMDLDLKVITEEQADKVFKDAIQVNYTDSAKLSEEYKLRKQRFTQKIKDQIEKLEPTLKTPTTSSIENNTEQNFQKNDKKTTIQDQILTPKQRAIPKIQNVTDGKTLKTPKKSFTENNTQSKQNFQKNDEKRTTQNPIVTPKEWVTLSKIEKVTDDKKNTILEKFKSNITFRNAKEVKEGDVDALFLDMKNLFLNHFATELKSEESQDSKLKEHIKEFIKIYKMAKKYNKKDNTNYGVSNYLFRTKEGAAMRGDLSKNSKYHKYAKISYEIQQSNLSKGFSSPKDSQTGARAHRMFDFIDEVDINLMSDKGVQNLKFFKDTLNTI